jgi:hypothetical protein
MDMSEVIVNSVAGKKKEVITSAVQQMRIVKIVYIYIVNIGFGRG